MLVGRECQRRGGLLGTARHASLRALQLTGREIQEASRPGCGSCLAVDRAVTPATSRLGVLRVNEPHDLLPLVLYLRILVTANQVRTGRACTSLHSTQRLLLNQICAYHLAGAISFVG